MDDLQTLLLPRLLAFTRNIYESHITTRSLYHFRHVNYGVLSLLLLVRPNLHFGVLADLHSVRVLRRINLARTLVFDI